MRKSIDIRLPWPPRGLSPNARLNRYAKAKLFKDTRLLALAKTRRALIGAGVKDFVPVGDGRVNLTLICTPPVNRYRDEDNLIANCKATFDGIAGALAVDDHIFHLREQEWYDAKAPGELIVRIDWEGKDE